MIARQTQIVTDISTRGDLNKSTMPTKTHKVTSANNIDTNKGAKTSSISKENHSVDCRCRKNTGADEGLYSRLNDREFEDLLASLYTELKYDAARVDVETWDQFYSFPRLKVTGGRDENQLMPFVLQPSLFHRNFVPPTIYFESKLTSSSKPPVGLPESLMPHYKWKISSITPNSIRNCVAFMRFDAIRQNNQTDSFFIGSWCKHMVTAEFAQLDTWRKVNHYPGSFHLGRKDKLCQRLKLALSKYGADDFGNFHPQTFVLPRDYDELKEYWSASPSKLFIIKPPASARGNGIKVINDINQIPESALQAAPQPDGLPSKKSTMIVQQYLSNPCLLENGQKFDLRVYVLLTSIDPLRIYVYDEGLVRFASSKYNKQEEGIIDQFMHLTNYFINKNNRDYQINNDCNSLNGCKWTLTRFWRYLNEHHSHIDTKRLWEDIKEIIVKTMICCEGPMTRLSHQNCKSDYTSYELFGFDIILDENFKPWILEVNITPSLKSESELDTSVKYKVIKDMFNTVGYQLPQLPSARTTKPSHAHLFLDERLYVEPASKRDKLKQARCIKLYKSMLESDAAPPVERAAGEQHEDDCKANGVSTSSSMSSVSSSTATTAATAQLNGTHISKSFYSDNLLDELTQNDIRMLMLSEDELSRSGRFRRVFPTANSDKYFKYFDKTRYNNLLLHAWERCYAHDRREGISRLSHLATFMNGIMP